ncbi:hypothetical protein [Oscillibacter sp.]|uniref:hypothetical protein n=1 Tax=Oscillibacter sp. TaxID=1945593 RepID=UPI00289A6876|nr:hypothetical protein [Oscillibacter sp.]
MSKKRQKRRKPVLRFELPLKADEEYSLMPHSIFDAHLSDAAFCVAGHLYRCRETISRQYPGAELIALTMHEDPDFIRCCEAELTKAGVLLLHEDGTFDMKDIADEACNV